MASKYGAAAPDANPELSSTFMIEIDNVQLMAFEEVKIGPSEWGVGVTRTGVDRLIRQTFSGILKETTIAIKKTLRVGGVVDMRVFINWHKSGSLDRRNGSVVLLDRQGQETLRFNFRNAWVSGRPEIVMNAAQEDAKQELTFTLSVSEVELA